MINRGFEAARIGGICDVEAPELVVEILGSDAERMWAGAIAMEGAESMGIESKAVKGCWRSM